MDANLFDVQLLPNFLTRFCFHISFVHAVVFSPWFLLFSYDHIWLWIVVGEHHCFSFTNIHSRSPPQTERELLNCRRAVNRVTPKHLTLENWNGKNLSTTRKDIHVAVPICCLLSFHLQCWILLAHRVLHKYTYSASQNFDCWALWIEIGYLPKIIQDSLFLQVLSETSPTIPKGWSESLLSLLASLW